MSPPLERITSAANPRYRLWKRYVAHPEAPDCPWIAVEGWKQIGELAAGRRVRLLLAEIETDRKRLRAAIRFSEEIVLLSRRLLEAMSRVRAPQGAVAFFDKPCWSWADQRDCVLYLDGIQDPGNLGSMLRSAAAFDFGLVTAAGTVSCLNEKVVRASAGYLFQTPWIEGVGVEELRSRGYQIWVADTRAGLQVDQAPLKPPVAVVVGPEGGAARVAEGGGRRVRIPMNPGVDSLNAAVAAALLMFEVFRRRDPPQIHRLHRMM